MTFPLTAEQELACNAVLGFLRDPEPGRPFFTMGGLAGTGKTTVLAEIIKRLGADNYPYLVGTPTGKAAAVLRRKGVRAATVHKLCYVCQGHDGGRMQFEFVGLKDEGDRDVAAMLIDEASMVSQPMLNDLLSSGLKLVFIGDYGQLPPVGADPKLMANCDVRLTQVLRQQSHLLEVCHAFRNGTVLGRHFTLDETVARYATAGTPTANEWMDQADIIVCAKNHTRHSINRHRLIQIGIDVPPGPVETMDRAKLAEDLATEGRMVPLVCTKNDYDNEIMNGETLFVRPFKFDGKLLYCDWLPEPERKIAINHASLFAATGTVPFFAKGTQCDFAWAVTCHKAQGSEWRHVAVVDERMSRMDDDTYRRWRYTAATRAKKKLTWVGSYRR